MSKAECLEEAGLDMNGIEKNESHATTSEDLAGSPRVPKKALSHRQPHSGHGQPLREKKTFLSGT